MDKRIILSILGGSVGIIGLAGIFRPDLIQYLAASEPFVIALGTASIILSVIVLHRRKDFKRSSADLPDVQNRTDVGRVGAKFDDGLLKRRPWVRDYLNEIVADVTSTGWRPDDQLAQEFLDSESAGPDTIRRRM
ncbi:MAG: hypothetical protein ABEI52_03925, partial [Halobacteriaceae archaeon]